MSKTQPEDEEVIAAINRVVDSNPDFGVKRVGSVLKENNPDWAISEKRVTKLLKKVKSEKIDLGNENVASNSQTSASPWNLAPEPTAAPASNSSPWNLAPTSGGAVESVVSTVKSAGASAVQSVQGFVEEVTARSPVAPKQGFVEEVAAPPKSTPAPTSAPASGNGGAWNLTPQAPVVAAPVSLKKEPSLLEKASDVVKKVEETAAPVVEKVQTWNLAPEVEKVEEKVKDAAAATADAAKSAYNKTSEVVKNAVEATEDKAKEVAEKTKEVASEAKVAVVKGYEDASVAVKKNIPQLPVESSAETKSFCGCTIL